MNIIDAKTPSFTRRFTCHVCRSVAEATESDLRAWRDNEPDRAFWGGQDVRFRVRCPVCRTWVEISEKAIPEFVRLTVMRRSHV